MIERVDGGGIGWLYVGAIVGGVNNGDGGGCSPPLVGVVAGELDGVVGDDGLVGW